MRRAIALAAALLAGGGGAAGCAGGPLAYPGRDDARAGDRPLIRIEPTNADETSPRELRVAPGTEVTWRNVSHELVFVRFARDVADRDVCGTPLRWTRTFDGRGYSTPFLPPFADARLCLAGPGRYDFIVSSGGRGGGGSTSPDGGADNGTSPVRYGTVIVE
jgi:hypothetical protein